MKVPPFKKISADVAQAEIISVRKKMNFSLP